MVKLKQVWLSEEAHRSIKIKAAENNSSVADYLDNVLLGESTRKKKKGGYDFF